MPDKTKMRLLVAALRSGDYEQGSGYLKIRDTDDTKFLHCCLGVACEVAITNGVEVTTSEFTNDDGRPTIKFDGRSDFMPTSVLQWYGHTGSDFQVRVDGDVISGANANDNFRKSFEQIATGLEEYYNLLESDDDTPATD